MSHIIVNGDGVIRFVWNDTFAEMLDEGTSTVRRVSHVEPTDAGTWTANLAPVEGPVLGPFRKREDAIAAEIKWLTDNGF